MPGLGAGRREQLVGRRLACAGAGTGGEQRRRGAAGDLRPVELKALGQRACGGRVDLNAALVQSLRPQHAALSGGG